MTKNYKIGFTRPALLREIVILAQLYTDHQDWQRVREEVIKENLLQTRTARSSEVLYGEMQKRLSLLNSEQIELIADDYEGDVRQLVWMSICKQYPFVGDFVLEIVAPAIASGRQSIDYDDYGYFFNAKAEWHQELEKVSEKTRSNARGAVFQMMRQCGLLTESNDLVPQMISAALQNCSSESDLALIPGAIRL
ncbi:DUF1819 family protein [Aequoribacter fuscus]|uniref:DUF1819 family protein n=1 Tax=Aequoribacter fuscus TaxID=2518989 RepID=UPI000592ECD2|nr:DUF1819 family protein [Aequoribacter fuscus]QHJ87555.1 DUF1819 family protein [Aequoribacter fuscus]